MSFFVAKDGNGSNFQVGANHDSENGVFYPVSGELVRPMISQFADNLGTGLGTITLIGDYSGAATDFWIEPPAGEIWHITRLIGAFRFGSALRSDRYGAEQLTNGIKVIHEVDGVENNLTSALTVKNFAQWGSYCYDVDDHSLGTGDNFVNWRWTFNKSGVSLSLDGDDNDKAIIRLEDDFTESGANLVEHTFLFQGHKLVGA